MGCDMRNSHQVCGEPAVVDKGGVISERGDCQVAVGEWVSGIKAGINCGGLIRGTSPAPLGVISIEGMKDVDEE